MDNILTQNEEKVLRTIQKFFETKSLMPTVREIKDEVKKIGITVNSLGAIFRYIKLLEEKGYIEREEGRKRRGIKLVGGMKDMFRQVPIFGAINAGNPNIFALDNIEGYLRVSSRLLPNKDVFGLRVSGDSMNLCEVKGTKIEDEDFILIDPNDQEYKDGDKVAVIIDGVATVKIFKRTGRMQIGLFPKSTNPIHKPIYLTPQDNFIIKGKVVGVLKHFS
ncbi:MAG: transcriptional repressor LexA [Candidatus Paceibacterota bacterium]